VTILRLEALGRLLHAAPPQAGPTRILAIDGRGGSGKSTLARRVAAVLEAPVLHMDDLYPGWDGLAAAAPLLRRWVVEPLTRGEPGRFHRYDWERDTYGDWVDLPASDSLVVEGCGCGSRIVAPFLSLLLWVDAPLSVRFDRGIHRDGAAFRPHWERWARQEDELFAAEHTRERADYRIDGAPLQPHDPEHEVVLVP
jgi:cytidylate kinase